jgi:hypothetical protein
MWRLAVDFGYDVSMDNDQLVQLVKANATFIQQLNTNMEILEKNIDTILNVNKETARDIIALQKAVLQFLAVKDIIKDENDMRIFQRLHMKNIADTDQQTAKKRDGDTNP